MTDRFRVLKSKFGGQPTRRRDGSFIPTVVANSSSASQWASRITWFGLIPKATIYRKSAICKLAQRLPCTSRIMSVPIPGCI